ncbi:MAG: ABC transporter ATP-binding protein [Phycisphaerales bacterium]
MIDIRNITKHFGPFVAVDDVSFSAHRGEVLGFLGPNGAGKSTTMKMVTGYLTPTRGTALVCGHDVVSDPIRVKEKIGYLPEGAPAYPDMTPEGFLRFVAQVRGISGKQRHARLEHVVNAVHLEGVMRQPIETLSKGYKRRVGLAAAILHDPDVLIMDEPTDGLDPNQKHEVRALIASMAPTKTIVLSTHILEEVEAVCTRAVILSRGKIVADGTPAQLQARSRYHNAVQVKVLGVPADAVRSELARLPHVSGVETVSVASGPASHPPASSNGFPSLRVYPKPGREILADVSQCARAKGWQLDELRLETGRLDDVFRAITGGSAPPDRAPTVTPQEPRT